MRRWMIVWLAAALLWAGVARCDGLATGDDWREQVERCVAQPVIGTPSAECQIWMGTGTGGLVD